MKKRIALALCGPLIAATAACTPGQIQSWIAWHEQDPAAAQEFAAQPDVQASLATGEHEAVEEVSSSGGCDGIYDEMIRQGAGSGVASRFAYRIAPRESGCSPQYVHDGDDWSYSRFGLNGLTAGLRSNWAAWCGADVRSDTKNLSVDVRSALAAYHRMGWAPWS